MNWSSVLFSLSPKSEPERVVSRQFLSVIMGGGLKLGHWWRTAVTDDLSGGSGRAVPSSMASATVRRARNIAGTVPVPAVAQLVHRSPIGCHGTPF